MVVAPCFGLASRLETAPPSRFLRRQDQAVPLQLLPSRLALGHALLVPGVAPPATAPAGSHALAAGQAGDGVIHAGASSAGPCSGRGGGRREGAQARAWSQTSRRQGAPRTVNAAHAASQ